MRVRWIAAFLVLSMSVPGHAAGIFDTKLCVDVISGMDSLDQIIKRHKVKLLVPHDLVTSLKSGKERPEASRNMSDYKELPLEIRNRLGLFMEDLTFTILNNQARAFTPSANRESTGYFESRGLDIALKNMSDDEYIKLFDPLMRGLSEVELIALYRGINLGLIKASPEQAALVKDLVHFTLDYGPIFWTGPAKVQHAMNTEDFSVLDVKQSVLSALEQADRDWKLAESSEDQSRFVHRGVQLSLLNLLSKGLKEKRALDEGRTPKRETPSLFEENPHQVVMAAISEANYATRHAQLAVQLDEAPRKALDGLADRFDLNAEERASIQSMLADTEGQLQESSENLGTLFGAPGRVPTLSKPISEEEIDLHAIEFNLGRSDARDEFAELQSIGLENMRDIEKIFEKAAARLGVDAPPRKDLGSVFMQILGKDYANRSEELAQKYFDLMTNERRVPKRADYEAQVIWTVDYTYNEKIGDEIHERNGTMEIKSNTRGVASYEELLSGTLDPGPKPDVVIPAELSGRSISDFSYELRNPRLSSDDVVSPAYLLNMSSEARKFEEPSRKALSALDEHFAGLNDGTYRQVVSVEERRVDYLGQVAKAIESVKTLRQELKSYLQKTKSQIHSNWEFDSHAHFHERNRINLERLEVMQKRLELLQGMLDAKVPELGVQFRSVDMGEDTLLLRRRNLRSAQVQLRRWMDQRTRDWDRRQVAVGAGLGGVGIAGMAYWLFSDDHDDESGDFEAGVFPEQEAIDYEDFKSTLTELEEISE